ncbi:MAG: InlB B-repeat-containing protein [Lachnospiraceae bacterium]|nr:InlB B-repeat-containing protein [Lachnospiraceae bacterium]
MKVKIKHWMQGICPKHHAMRRVLAVLLCVVMVGGLFVDSTADAKSAGNIQTVTTAVESLVSAPVASEGMKVSAPVEIDSRVETKVNLSDSHIEGTKAVPEASNMQLDSQFGDMQLRAQRAAKNVYYVGVTPPDYGDVVDNYNASSQIATLVAVPRPGCRFEFWSEYFTDEDGKEKERLIQDEDPYSSTYSWRVNTNGRTVIAHFRKDGEYFIWQNVYSSKGSITITNNTENESYKPGYELNIVANAYNGYKVVGIQWGYVVGNGTEGNENVEWQTISNGNTASLKMPNHDIWIQAVFYSTAEHTVSLSTDGNGTVTFKNSNATTGTFREGDVVEVTVKPKQYYRLSSITGLYSEFDLETYSFIMPDIDLNLNFGFKYAATAYEVKLVTNAKNYVDYQVEVLDEANQICKATTSVKSDYIHYFAFLGWYDYVDANNMTLLSTDTEYIFRLDRNFTLAALYANGKMLYLAQTDAGVLSAMPQKDCYVPGETVRLFAVPKDNYYLDGYSKADYINGELSEFEKIDGDTIVFGDNVIAVKADFIPYVICNVTANIPEAGKVTGTGKYRKGDTIVFEATPNEGYVFRYWANKSDETGMISDKTTYTYKVNSDKGGEINLVAVFQELPKYTITATPNSTYGTVEGAGTYHKGAKATLTATPNNNCVFVNWTENGNVVSTDSTYTFEVTQNRTLIAVFKPEIVTVSAVANEAAFGSVSGAGVFSKGMSVTLTATANTGYRFVNWTEGNTIVSSKADYPFTAERDINLIANFVVDEDTIDVSSNNDKYGSVSGGGTYQKGKNVEVTATANEGYEFVNWTENGNVVSTDATYSFLMANARTLVANFKPKTFNVTISASPSEGGTVEKSGTCEYDTEVNVKATPAEGYRFLNWSEGGNPVSTNAEFSFMVSKDRALTAIFEKIVYYNIGVSPASLDYGTVTGGGLYEAKTPVEVVAIPKKGFIFTNWTENGTVVSEKAKYTFTASANRTLVAHFDVDYREINVSTSDVTLGSVSGGGRIQVGQKATVIATANQNCRFVNWTENGVPVTTDATYEFTVEKEWNLVAVFEEIGKVTINAVSSDSNLGSVSGGGTHYVGSKVTLVATAFKNCRFVSWTENGEVVSSSVEFIFTAEQTRSLVANFEKIMYTISAEPNNSAYGTVTGAGDYQQGVTVNLTATASKGYRFVKWTEDGQPVSSNASYSFECKTNRNIVAVFEAIPTFTVTVSSNDSTLGSVSGGGKVYEGKTVTVTATAMEYCLFVEWQMNGKSVSTNPTYTFAPNSDCTLVAVFAEDKAKVTVASNDTTFGSVSGGGEFQKGSDVTVIATAADDDHRFVNWTENGEEVSTSSEYKFTLEKDIALVANFKKIERYTVEAVSSNDAAGSVLVIRGPIFEVGDRAILLARPGEEGIFENWTENGTVVCTTPAYSFIVENDRNLVANFKLKTYTVQVQANYSSYGSVSGGGDFTKGQTATVTATAENGYLFDHWDLNGNNESDQSSYSFAVSGDVALVAVFKEDPNGVSYPLSVCGIKVTSKNKDDIMGDGTVTYKGDAKKGTLTLNNANLKYFDDCILCGEGLELTIYLVGDNSITSDWCGIFKEKGFELITITGSGKLTITGGTAGVSSDGYLAIKGSTIVISLDRKNSRGFYVGGGIEVSENSDITVTADFCAVYCSLGTVTVSDGSELKLTTTGQKSESQYCLYARHGLVVNDGCKLTVKGNSLNGIKTGDGWSVKLLSPEVSISALNSAIEAPSGITLGNGIMIATPAGGQISNDGERIVDADGNVAKDVTLTKGITINATASSKEAGTVEGAGCYAQGAGTTVKLKAIPNEGYEFVSWTENGQIVSDKAAYEFSLQDERTLVANFLKKKFTITFRNDDGTKLQSETVEYGVKPVYNGKTPTKAATKQYTYTFAGWDSEIIEVAGDATYTATYDHKVNSYRIRFVNDDGTELQSEMVEYGVKPVYNGKTPTKAATKQYTYTFAAWDSEIIEVVGDATYTATYDHKVNSYRIRFVNDDGTELQSEVLDFGAKPVYNGKTPAKAATKQYTYTFAGWDNEVIAVAGDATYTAKYDSKLNSYQVAFEANGGSEISAKTVEYGSKLENVADPVRKGFDFIGWFTDAACTKKADLTAPITDDCKFYAGWEEVFFTVTGDTSWDVKSGKDFHIHVTRSRNDDILFGMFGGILLDGKPVDGKYFKAVKGSIDLTVSSELFKTIEDGNHEITVLIGDTSVTAKVAVSNDTGRNEAIDAPKTGDTTPTLVLMFLVLAALLMSGVVLYRRKNARA